MKTLGNWKSQHWVILEKIRYTLGFSDREFSDLLKLSQRQFRSLRTRGVGIPACSAFELSEAVYVSFEKLMSGKIDFEVMKTNFRNPHPLLPRRYSYEAFSKVRTSCHHLGFLREVHGEKKTHNILKNLQVRPEILLNPDSDISALFLDDLCREMLKLGLSQEQLFSIALGFVSYNRNTRFGRLLRSEPTVKRMYEKVFTELTPYFDANCHYLIEDLTDQMVRIKVVQSQLSQSELSAGAWGSSLLCINRAGICASFPQYHYRPSAKVKKTSCIYSGDSHCLFEFHFVEGNIYYPPRLAC